MCHLLLQNKDKLKKNCFVSVRESFQKKSSLIIIKGKN